MDGKYFLSKARMNIEICGSTIAFCVASVALSENEKKKTRMMRTAFHSNLFVFFKPTPAMLFQ